MTIKIKVKDKLEDGTLDLSWCDLQEVPIKEIATIKKASHLDLSNNQLVSLPKTIVDLTHIVKLDLSKNSLTEIPENIGEMKQLRYLDLYCNQISRLPLSMGDLKNLKWLDLKDNPLTSAVASVAGPCSNTNECQQCARNIVSYLTYIRQTIEVERKRRNDVTTVSNTSAAANKKDNKKKKKKNAIKDEKQNEKVESVNFSEEIEDFNDRIHSNDNADKCGTKSSSSGICSSLCRLVYSTITFIILSGILMIFAVILLPRFNQPLSDKLTNYLQEQTKLPVKEYQKIGIEKYDSAAEITLEFLHKTRNLVAESFAKIVGRQHKCCSD